jgi:hypothetical protein
MKPQTEAGAAVRKDIPVGLRASAADSCEGRIETKQPATQPATRARRRHTPSAGRYVTLTILRDLAAEILDGCDMLPNYLSYRPPADPRPSNSSNHIGGISLDRYRGSETSGSLESKTQRYPRAIHRNRDPQLYGQRWVDIHRRGDNLFR